MNVHVQGWFDAAGVRSATTRTPDGVDLHYEVLGNRDPEAPALLLANGLGGRLYVWQDLVERLRDRYRILTWDYRGLFRSTSPPRRKGLSIPHHAADARHLLDVEGIDRAHLVGWSMGVQVSLELALECPQRVRSLTLLNGAPGHVLQTGLQPVIRMPLGHRTLHATIELLERSPRLVGVISAAIRSRLHSRVVSALLGAWGYDARLEAMYSQYVDDVFGPSFPNYLRLFQELDAHSVYHLLPDIQQPTFVVSGRLDYLTPAVLADRIARRIPNAQHLRLPWGSHFAVLEYPDLVLDRLEAFLAAS